MSVIALNKERVAIVDDGIFDYINQWRWHVSPKGYAVRRPRVNGKRYTIHMHRLINDTPDHLQTDHINRDRLDNRRSNLRSVTNQENSLNKGINKNNTSGYKGVSWDKTRGSWKAHITTGGAMINIGRYQTKDEARKARKEHEQLLSQHNSLTINI